MKKLLIATIILALLFSVSSFAQDSHLKFKGIPIDGNYVTFAQKLIQKGFRQVEEADYGVVLKGSFMAKPDVTVVVYANPVSKVVSSVAACIKPGNNWALLEKEYYSIVDTYKQKYGEPFNQTEGFSTRVDGEYDRLSAIRDGQCDYKTEWVVEGGGIMITFQYVEYNYYVCCIYMDEQNMTALKQTIIDDI